MEKKIGSIIYLEPIFFSILSIKRKEWRRRLVPGI